MIGWHEVDFIHVRMGGTYSVRCCPIGNKDERLLIRGPAARWKNGEGPFTPGVWDEGERECFRQLRAKLQELEAGCEPTAAGYVLQQLHAAEHRVKELEGEIESMRVTDPSELAAQLLNMKMTGSSEVFLPDDSAPLSEPAPRMVRSEPGGYDSPEPKKGRS